MTDEQISISYNSIKKSITELEKSILHLEEKCKPIEPSVSLGRLTRMEALGEKGVNEAILSQNRVRLDKLKSAQQRIIEGTYGKCLQCGKDISNGRLKAVPEAMVCIPCKEKKS